MKGKIVVIEGTDCSGKETQGKLLVDELNKIGHKAIYFSFPMYDSPTGKIVGGPYLGKPEIMDSWFGEGAINLNPKIACLYYAADRKYNIDMIFKYLNAGYYVVIDRYISSNMAHQGSKIQDPEERFLMYQWIDKLEYWLLELPKPDITIFLHVPYNYAKKLMVNRLHLDEHEKNEQHLLNAEKAYIELSELYNWCTIECVKDNKMKVIKDINQEILKIIIKEETK